MAAPVASIRFQDGADLSSFLRLLLLLPSSAGYVSGPSMGVRMKRILRKSSSAPISSSSSLGDVGASDCVRGCVHGCVIVLLVLSRFFLFLLFIFSFSFLFLFSFSLVFLSLSFMFSFSFSFLFCFSFSFVPFLVFFCFFRSVSRPVFVPLFSFSFSPFFFFFSSFVCFVSVVLFCFRFLSFVLFLFSPVSSCVWVCRFPVLPVWRAFLFLPFCALFFSRWRRFFPPIPSPFLFFFFSPILRLAFLGGSSYVSINIDWALLLILVVVLRFAFLLYNYRCRFAFYPRNRC